MIPPPYSYMPYPDWRHMGSYVYTYSKRWPTATMVLHNYRRGYGLGYDSVSDDYKLVLIDDTLELGDISIVYSMKRNYWEWSRIPLDLFMLEARGSFVEGFLNWGSGRNIVAFALDTEEFCQVPLPNGIKGLALMNVGVLGGCLMMTHANISESKRNVWVMKDYMVKDSWSKLYVLPSVPIKVIDQISSE
ncbi:F-box protein CPR30-like [Tripterygium wilfordii]|uniref:F-box protein CPR30-like n=2 Tax=Tripterygium wilfordii TaxID=458696 RepID=A0A7J7DUA0_TRIWF|nr:F-box protein CPR30-like [Tripterygium wilfordii]